MLAQQTRADLTDTPVNVSVEYPIDLHVSECPCKSSQMLLLGFKGSEYAPADISTEDAKFPPCGRVLDR